MAADLAYYSPKKVPIKAQSFAGFFPVTAPVELFTHAKIFTLPLTAGLTVLPVTVPANDHSLDADPHLFFFATSCDTATLTVVVPAGPPRWAAPAGFHVMTAEYAPAAVGNGWLIPVVLPPVMAGCVQPCNDQLPPAVPDKV
jgi:hypothetical protein